MFSIKSSVKQLQIWLISASLLTLQLQVAAQQAGDQLSEIEANARSILQGLTLEQKVAQMMQGEIQHVTPEDVRRYGLGSVLNGGGSFPGANKHATQTDWLELADAYYEASMASPAGIPIIWGTDAVHGHNNVIGATLFPHNIGLGAANNPQLVETIGTITALEVLATGIDWIFAPTVAIAKDDRWGRTYEAYSDQPEIVGKYSAAIVEGMQAAGIVATAKHFIGDGGTFRGIDQGDTRLDLRELLLQHGEGYATALNAGVLTVMASFNSWNGDKIHGNQMLLTNVLKESMGFEGFVVSDWNGTGQVEGCANDSCPQAINAGIDMVMATEFWKPMLANTVQQVNDGLIPMERIDDAVFRILKVKLQAGLFAGLTPSQRASAKTAAAGFPDISQIIGTEQHREVARQAVRESLVLLKNNGRLLPLDRNQRVLVAGSGADNIGQQNGGWTITWQGTGNTNDDFPGATSVYDGINQALEFADGSAELSIDGAFDERPDVAIVVFGETPYAEGVGDVETLAWQQADNSDLQLLQSFRSQGIPVVAILLTGRPLWLNAEINAADAFVVAWLPGTEGAGIADVLFRNPAGEIAHDFIGKLSFDWPNADINSANEDAPVDDILFPYGYGLTYANHSELDATLPETPAGVRTTNDEVIFDKDTRQPWILSIGDSNNWDMPVVQRTQQTQTGGLTITSVDYQIQEDARQIQWHRQGRKERQVFWRSDSPQDLREFHEKDAALTVEFKVDQHPQGRVTFRMGCGTDCNGTMDMTPVFEQMPLNQWATLSIPLACFQEAGVDFENITSPFTIISTREFAMTLSKVVIEESPSEQSLLNCN